MKTSTQIALAIRSRAAAPLIGLLALLAFGGPASAATDIFIKFEGVEGEEVGRFEGWSRLLGAIGDVGAPSSSDPNLPPVASSGLSVLKRIDKSSPLLMKASGDGSVLPRATLAWIENDVVYFRITLKDVLISSFSTAAETGATLPVETISLSYQKIEWSCIAGNGPTGGLTATFDLVTQEAALKIRRPFRAGIETREGERGVHVTCPVEAGHRYRLSGNNSMEDPWEPIEEFVAPEDGTIDRFIPMEFPNLFLRVEALD